MTRHLVVFAGLLLAAHMAVAQLVQQGSKLVAAGTVGNSRQGRAVAISADGNLAIIGGPDDRDGGGSAWVWARTGAAWSQESGTLVGTGGQNDPFNAPHRGSAVAISADGSTALVGSALDNRHAGAVWVFTRGPGGWLQEGSKLVGSGAVGTAEQGFSVALSADGNTALVGGLRDDGWTGAVWVYTRSGGAWSQQGAKLVGTGAVGVAYQGASVALSADGNTAIVGGWADDSHAGAAWVYTRSGGVWTQQGDKLTGSGAVGAAQQGFSVALSADGNAAVLGGPFDNSHAGAAWVFTRSGGVWSQQGGKLVGAGAAGAAELGWSAGISADGNTAIVGGPWDNAYAGAAWVFTRDGGVWSQLGDKLVGSGAVGSAGQGVSVAPSGDGATAIVGGWADNRTGNFTSGAAWVFHSPQAGQAVVPGSIRGEVLGRGGQRDDLGALDPAPTAPIDEMTAVANAEESMPVAPVAPPSRLLGTVLPSAINLSNELPPVKDQGVGFGTGQTCVIWACTYYQLTEYVKHFEHPEWDLSRPEYQFSVSFVAFLGGGGFAPKAYAVLKEDGCTDMAELPYGESTLNKPPSPAQLEAAKPYRIKTYAALWDHRGVEPPYSAPNDIENAKAWLADGHVLATGICTEMGDFPDSYGFPPTTYYDPPSWNSGCSNHYVAIAGFDDNINPSGATPEHRGGFLMVNSWGPEWNGDMRGYLWVSYDWVAKYNVNAYVIADGGNDTPSITGISPQSAKVGDSVTIRGENFGTSRRASGVSFNGTRAKVVSMVNDSVTAIVPEGATSGPVVVYNWDGAPSNQIDFRVDAVPRVRTHLY